MKHTVLALISLFGLAFSADAQTPRAWAIAIGDAPIGTWQTPVYSSPNVESDAAGQLRSGQLIDLFGTQGGWVFAGLGDGTKGFIPKHLLLTFSADMRELSQFDPMAVQTLMASVFNFRGYCFPDDAMADRFDNSDCDTRRPKLSPNEIALINGLSRAAPQFAADYAGFDPLAAQIGGEPQLQPRELTDWGTRPCDEDETPAEDHCFR